jgi:hypothetical protein
MHRYQAVIPQLSSAPASGVHGGVGAMPLSVGSTSVAVIESVPASAERKRKDKNNDDDDNSDDKKPRPNR